MTKTDGKKQMIQTLKLLTCLSISILFLGSCERPKSVDFQTTHEFETPLTKQKTYLFLGQSEALIDTTSEDYEDLFSTASDGLVSISKSEDFDFGDLDDAIPSVDADPTTLNAEVGEIGLTNFNSGSGNAGSVSASDILPPGSSNLQEGDFLPPASANDIQIDDFETENFESATVKNDGTLNIVITNNLGFNADNTLSVTLESNGTPVGSDDISPVNHTSTDTARINISAGTQLSNLGIEVDLAWSGQTMQQDANEGELIVEEVFGQDDSDPTQGLIFSQVTAAIESQSFNDTGTSNIDQNSFEFRTSNHFVELGNGELVLNIANNIDLAVETLNLNFPDIIDASGDPLDLSFTDISASSDGGDFSYTEDLSGYQIRAQNGTINYSVSASTENTQEGANSETRVISESDALDAQVDINNLEISRALGYVVPKRVLLTEDVTNDGRENLDVFNDDEASITSIDGIGDISDRINDITFANPTLNTSYLTNLGVETTIYAAIAGTDSKGNTVYLTGNDNTPFDVDANDIPQGLEANGQPLTEDQIIKFSIETADDPNPQQGEQGNNIFDTDGTNISAFFSNLPTKIRFVGIAAVNEAQQTGEIVNPVIFDPSLSLDLPINFSAQNATFQDTLEADLSDLPGDSEDEELAEATLTINYTNGLPLNLDLSVTLIDENGDVVETKDGISVSSATTNDQGFVSDGGAAQSQTQISFSEDELQNLNDTREIEMDISINTPQQQAVKIRGDDSISFDIKLKAGITSTVN